ncbi:MFS transporter [Paenibacillus sp. N1-5-1-14]|uniref:MFS transporter n=1 Tax=Paenibacillus radicibacter TaxID=2972488 RepID=UPI002158A695|nr:MFS transporter [Paenibacillus radicibacter]MCR8641289.1 MFS transporter [Paenibacillus radicibacter]
MVSEKNRKWWVLGALAVSLLTVGLDITVLNLALPTLASKMHATNSELQWFADAYNLVIASLLLPAGLLGDKLGRKKMLLIALLIFGIASMICAFSDTPNQLIVGRLLLGLGAAFLLPLSMSIIPVLFTEEERSKAIGIWVMANFLGIPLGPILGGWLLKNYWWGSVFLINLPIILIGIVAIFFLLKESKSTDRIKVDYLGTLLSSIGMIALTYGFIEVGERGWSNMIAMGSMFGGLAILILFILWERKVEHPLIDLKLFKSSSFTWGSILATIVSFAMFGLLFVLPQYLQAVGGYDTLGTGLRLLPIVGGLLVGAKLVDVLKKLSPKAIFVIGFLLLVIGLVIGSNTSLTDGYGFACIWISIVGLGIGLILPTAMDVSMSALSPERSGIGSAIIMTLRQIGGTIGIAILGSMLSVVYRDKLYVEGLPSDAVDLVERNVSSGVAVAQNLKSTPLLDSVRGAFVHGMDTLLWVCAGVTVFGMILTLVCLRLPRNEKEGQSKNVIRS